MAISHICHQCGWDLARVRAVPDPTYGLPLVTCPRCGGHAVRRRHPLIQRHRDAAKAIKATVIFVAQSCIALGLLGLTVPFMVGFALAWRLGAPTSHVEMFWWQMAVSGGLLAIVTGLWLSIGLNHLGIVRAWLGWMTTATIIFAITAAIIGVAGGLADMQNRPFDPEHAWSWFVPALNFFLAPGIASMLLVSALSLLMFPIGHVVLRMNRLGRRTSWRWRRRRRRIRFIT